MIRRVVVIVLLVAMSGLLVYGAAHRTGHVLATSERGSGALADQVSGELNLEGQGSGAGGGGTGQRAGLGNRNGMGRGLRDGTGQGRSDMSTEIPDQRFSGAY